MDLLSLNVKNAAGDPRLFRNLSRGRPSSGTTVLEISVLRRHSRPSLAAGNRADHRRSLSVRCLAKKNPSDSPSPGNGDHSTPEGDGLRGSNSSERRKSNDHAAQKSQTSLDWREFRANLFAREQAEKVESDDVHGEGGVNHESKPLGAKWAHPIPVPETGCVLVATEKLDGVLTFERTVVLLLRAGTRHPQEGPFGVVINRPLRKKIKDMNPSNHDLATYFSNCSLHFGGPLEASMFLLKNSGGKLKSKRPGFEEVIPGLSFGARNSLDEFAAMVRKGLLKPQDFRFFTGYAGWQYDQLREEIESNYWYVAACSSDLICGESADSLSGLWEEILQLMGGHYSELSRKPKQDM
ncbi:hypothetical protein SAY87_014272 [Trapa incisa]|uniref:Uncharacterized protein n=1 Tax=Trapa incisa TaxID=236973 RepID=A0AAN7GJQ1_9MYRT|nr:hypothetical protein SAY87_014272 [Trapa incisa]